MINAFTVQHNEPATDRSFEEVVAAFEAATSSVEKGESNAAVREAESLSEFEADGKHAPDDHHYFRCVSF